METGPGHQGEEACQESHRAWACSQVLWFQYPGFSHHVSRHLPLPVPKAFVAQFVGGLLKHITSGCAPQKLLHGCRGSRVGKEGVTKAWQEGFHSLSAVEQCEFPMCSPACRVPREISLAGAWLTRFPGVRVKSKWSQKKVRCALGERSQSERLHVGIAAAYHSGKLQKLSQ